MRCCHSTPEDRRRAVEALAMVIGEKIDEEKNKRYG
jgi:hypothetical protein